jgi:hypothetical protein
VAFVALVAVSGPRFASAADELAIAIIVGSNESKGSGLKALSYADDDAIRAALLFRMLGARTTILVKPDADTQKRFPSDRFSWLQNPEEPTRANLQKAVQEAIRDSLKAHGEEPPRKTSIYFVYSGHGGRSSEGEGALLLEDGPFWRSNLYEDLLARSLPGPSGLPDVDHIHVIIDSCYASNTISSKGGGGPVPTNGHQMSAISQKLDDYPNVGVILAKNASGKTQEWELYLGGIFSHQILSALFGAADISSPAEPGDAPRFTPDETINYTEAAVFLRVANAGTPPAQQDKLKVFVKPPGADPVARLVTWRTLQVPRLRLKHGGHLWINDSTGNRWVELNKPEGVETVLVLPERSDYELYRAEGAALEGKKLFHFPARPGEPLDEDTLQRSNDAKPSRGAPDAELQNLFTVVYGPDVLKVESDAHLFDPPPGWDSAVDMVKDSPLSALDRPIYKKWWFWTAAAALVGGAITTALVLQSREPNCPAMADCKSPR